MGICFSQPNKGLLENEEFTHSKVITSSNIDMSPRLRFERQLMAQRFLKVTNDLETTEKKSLNIYSIESLTGVHRNYAVSLEIQALN